MALLSLAQGYLDGLGTRSQLLAGSFFAFLMAFYVWQLVGQVRDTRPLLVVAPEGLHLPAAREAPIAWGSIRQIVCRAALLGKGRIEFQVEPETYVSLRLGTRILGDAIVRRAAARCEFAILMQAADRGAVEVFTAIRRYWTPPQC
ncbi:MAG TPA: hypothetical protein VGB82_01325 [Alphaproteobacteria bacterium]